MSVPSDAKDKSDAAFDALNAAARKTIERKRRLGQYWVVWDGEKPVEVHPEAPKDAAE